MASFSEKYANGFRKFLPTPFTIAIILTLIVFGIAYKWGNINDANRLVDISNSWYNGVWNTGGMKFAMQMMLMLLLGHVIALSKPIDTALNYLAKFGTTTAKAAAIVAFSTILVSLFNWGLGLVFGAIFAYKVGVYANKHNIPINYPLVGASGYTGLMVWHGGISGSAPIKASDAGHIQSLVIDNELKQIAPDFIPASDTIFSSSNLITSLALLIILPLFVYFLGTNVKPTKTPIQQKVLHSKKELNLIGAEKLDHSKWFGFFIGFLILFYLLVKVNGNVSSFSFLTPDFINLSLLGLGLIFHRSISNFLLGIDKAIGGVSGILIQFPIYFGIMGIMKDTGLITNISEWFSSISSADSFPVMTFFSAGLLNIFVPSGGGQWAVQGPIIIETALKNNISLSKTIMAMAYGDQLTNMLQPFWALPLLGITGLKAKDILPYTLLIMLVGLAIFVISILFLW